MAGLSARAVLRGSIGLGLEAPVNTVLPAISGDAEVGATLTTTTGTWDNSPESYAYQWKSDGVAIDGETTSSYVVQAIDVGTNISVTVTATNAAGSTPATSTEVGPVIEIDPHWSNVVLLLDFEGTDGATSTTDESPTTPHAITFNGSAQIDTAQAATGNSSLLCDGTTDYVTAPDNADWDFGAGDFTVECYVRLATVKNSQFVAHWLAAGGAGTASWTLYYESGALLARWYTAAGTLRTLSYTWTPSTNTQYHLAWDRDATGKFRTYINGVRVAVATYSAETLRNGSGLLQIGDLLGFAGYGLDGHIDGVRVTKGVARYATDSTFTPPTSYPRS